MCDDCIDSSPGVIFVVIGLFLLVAIVIGILVRDIFVLLILLICRYIHSCNCSQTGEHTYMRCMCTCTSVLAFKGKEHL